MSKRILVIDDDEAIRKSFSLALEDTECRVDTAESGEQGIEMEQKERYDLIYLDLKMPGLNGVDTLRELRRIDNDVPVYIVTAFHKEFFELLNCAVKDGVEFEVLQKPIGGDQIIHVTRGILEGATEI
ncbi:MAG: response regulator [Thermodesulfobacteriota bacterium]